MKRDDFQAFLDRNRETLELDENVYIGRLRDAGVFKTFEAEVLERVQFRHLARLMKEGAFDKPQPPRARERKPPTLTRALREAKKAGVPVAAATVTGQGVVLTIGEAATDSDANPWDEVLKNVAN